MTGPGRQIAWTKVAIAVFGVAVVAGPLYTVDNYRVASNLISELGAQHTPNNFLMMAAFSILGGGLVAAGLMNYSRAVLPFVLFGACMALVGPFPHKPIDPGIDYNTLLHGIHGSLATVAGVLLTIGFVWQGVLSRSTKARAVCFYLGAVGIVFPLLMLALPEYRGIVQRLMYLQVFVWLWFRYPEKIVTGPAA